MLTAVRLASWGMRAPATLLKAGFAAAAALLLLTACGGSDDESDAAGSSSSSSAGSSSAGSSSGSSSSAAGGSAGSSATTSDDDVQEFCTKAEEVFGGISDGLDAAEPTDLGTALDQGVAAFDTIQPPAEISADWNTLKGAFSGLRDAVAGVDLNTAEGQAAVQQAVTDLDAQSSQAQTNLDTWVNTNCDNA